jgi:type II secretory pathway predicted ATPase ExeA
MDEAKSKLESLNGANKRKVAKKAVHWGTRLDAFRKRYALSHRDLADVIVCLRKSAVFELCNGKCNPRMEAVIKPVISANLRTFLKEKQKHDLEIEREMLELFYEPDCKDKESEPVLTQRAVLPKTAQVFFGLRFDPFTADPRSRNEVFSTPKLDKIAGLIDDAILYQGFVGVVGDIGAGKSLLKRRVVQQCLDSNGKQQILWPEFMNMEKVHAGSICAFILRKFGQKSPHDLVQRADRLKELLASYSNSGIRVALGFDECHRLDSRLLTALKNFWEIGSGGYDRYLGLVLFGQPSFEMTLRSVEFKEITERLDIIHMPNLGKNAWDYIAHRLKIAGGTAEKLFERESVTRLAEIASTPLALGNLANSALVKAHQLNEHKVHRGILEAAGLMETEPRLRAALIEGSGRSSAENSFSPEISPPC